MSQSDMPLDDTSAGNGDKPGLRVVEFYAENLKRIEVVEIKPVGDVVQITGGNRQGKTSVLDAIWWALDGARHIQAEPIRRGAKEALVRLDLGEIIVRRTFRRGDAGVTTTLTAETKEGAQFRRPQQLIDSFFNALCLDPFAFTRMDSGERFKVLRGFVTSVDFEEIARLNKADYDARRDLNVSARSARSVAGRMTIADEDKLPAEPVNLDALTMELATVGEHNGGIEARSVRREQAQEFITRKTQEAAKSDDTAAHLREELDVTTRRLNYEISVAEEEATICREQAANVRIKLEEAGPLPEPIDTTEISRRINEAREINGKLDVVRQRKEAVAEADKIEAQAKALTEAMAARDLAATAAIAAAKLPIETLTLTLDGGVLLDGVPFEQASDAEQLGASIAIAVALNPRLRVIRVRDGSLLDADAMAALSAMARKHDCQIWIEVVGIGTGIGFELVAGRLRQDAPAEEPAA